MDTYATTIISLYYFLCTTICNKNENKEGKKVDNEEELHKG